MYLSLFTSFLLLFVGLAQSEDQNCDGIIIRGEKYEEEILKSGLIIPNQLSVDYTTNTLYFTEDVEVDKENQLLPAYIDLSSGDYVVIHGIDIGVATAVDNKNHIVYISSIDGLYTYDRPTNELKRVSELGGDIVSQMFEKDGDVYYTSFGSHIPSVYKDGKSRALTEVEMPDKYANFVGVDKNDNIWVEDAENELFCYIKEEGKTVSVGKYVVKGFTHDTEGNTYFIDHDGMYEIRDDRSVELVFKNKYMEAVTFDADNNIIYSRYGKIFRLKRTGVKC